MTLAIPVDLAPFGLDTRKASGTRRRPRRAVRILKDLSAETIYHPDGGIVARRGAALPTVQTDEEATE